MAAVLRPYFILDASPAAALGAGVTSNVDYTATSPMVIIDVHDVATATVGGSTAQGLSDPTGSGVFTAYSAALAMAVTSALTRGAAVTVAQRTISAGGVIRSQFVDGGAGGADGNLYTHLVKTPITGA